MPACWYWILSWLFILVSCFISSQQYCYQPSHKKAVWPRREGYCTNVKLLVCRCSVMHHVYKFYSLNNGHIVKGARNWNIQTLNIRLWPDACFAWLPYSTLQQTWLKPRLHSEIQGKHFGDWFIVSTWMFLPPSIQADRPEFCGSWYSHRCYNFYVSLNFIVAVIHPLRFSIHML
jgi:hypothetical protein